MLATAGTDELTMAAVAQRAGVSIGAIYGRFASKDQLLNAVKDRLLGRIEEDLASALNNAGDSLRELVEAFTRALADGFSAGTHAIPYVLVNARNQEATDRGVQALETIQRLFLDKAMHHLAEVRQPDPMTALVIVARTITGACIHRTMSAHIWPDGTSWGRWAAALSGMSVGYLTTPDAATPESGSVG